MAAIEKVKTKQGIRYRCRIRRRGFPAISKNFATKKAATAWGKSQERNVDDGKVPNNEAHRTDLKQLITKYVEDTDPDKKRVQHLDWWQKQIGHEFLANITSKQLKQLRTSLKEKHKMLGGRTVLESTQKLAPSTINRYHSALAAVFTYAVDELEWMNNNPAKFPQLTEDNKRDEWLDDDQRKALLDACNNSQWNGLPVLVQLALATGLRQGNLLNLEWSSVDLKLGNLYVARTKNGKPIEQPIIGDALPALRNWAKVRRLDSVLVFPSPTKPDKPFNFRKHWNKALEEAKSENFHFHDLRHSCATYLAKANVNQSQIMAIMGHRSLQASERYMHHNTEDKAAALEKVFGNGS